MKLDDLNAKHPNNIGIIDTSRYTKSIIEGITRTKDRNLLVVPG